MAEWAFPSVFLAAAAACLLGLDRLWLGRSRAFHVLMLVLVVLGLYSVALAATTGDLFAGVWQIAFAISPFTPLTPVLFYGGLAALMVYPLSTAGRRVLARLRRLLHGPL